VAHGSIDVGLILVEMQPAGIVQDVGSALVTIAASISNLLQDWGNITIVGKSDQIGYFLLEIYAPMNHSTEYRV
jgi:hypothetical protein